MELVEIISRWVLHDISLHQLQTKLQYIMEGREYSELAGKLVYAVSEEDNVDSMIQKFAKEHDIEYPTREKAFVNLTLCYAKKIVECVLDPIEGAKIIMNKIIYENDYLPNDEIMSYEALLSEYDDFSDEAHIEFYGQNKCMQELKRIESDIIDVSKNIINGKQKY